MQTTAIVKRLSLAVAAVLLGLALPSLGSAESDNGARRQFYRDMQGQAAAFAGQGGAAAVVGDVRVLSVSGVIGPGAHQQFRAALLRGSPGLVVLDGPGGILGEALLIAEEVRRRRLNTLVAANRSCASACAVVFLSGRSKFLEAGANVGLHSASYADGRADPEATELMAAYLRQVGVPAGTLRRMAQTAPNRIRWLTRAEQQAIGIRPYSRPN
jgi:membrane-bound ClpP family serine protease